MTDHPKRLYGVLYDEQPDCWWASVEPGGARRQKAKIVTYIPRPTVERLAEILWDCAGVPEGSLGEQVATAILNKLDGGA